MNSGVSIDNSVPHRKTPLASLWIFLTNPGQLVTNPQMRRQVQLLNALLIVLVITGALVVLNETLLNPNSIHDTDFVFLVATWVSCGVLYGVARRGYFRIAAFALVSLFFVFFTIIPFAANALPQLPFFVVLPLFLAAIFFSWREVVVLTILAVIIPAVCAYTFTSFDGLEQRQLARMVMYNVTMGGLILVYMNHRDAVERMRSTQLHDAFDQVRASEAELEARVDARTEELRQSEIALRASEQRYRNLVENISDIVYATDGNGNFTYMSPAAASLLGYGEDELIGRNYTTLIDATYRDMVIGFYQDQFRSKEAETVLEIPILTASGASMWVEQKVALAFENANKIKGFQAVVRDISERKEAERVLKQRDAILEAVAFSSETLLKSSDWQESIGEILSVVGRAASACRVYLFEKCAKSTPEEVFVRQVHEWVAEGTQPKFIEEGFDEFPFSAYFQIWIDAFEKGEIISGPVESFAASEWAVLKSQNIESFVGIPVMVDGRWWGFIGFDECTGQNEWTSTEIDTLRSVANNLGLIIQRQKNETRIEAQNAALMTANNELATARKQAEDANKLKSQFLATMSHELRTPLNAVIGYAQLQLEGMAGELNEDQMQFQERILVNSQHLLQLINEVLDISKIEAGRLELVERPFEVHALVREIISQNKVLAQNKGLQFEDEFDESLPNQLVGDRGRIKQIIINLISNAIKFTDDGHVFVQVKKQSSESWCILVKDTGIGIPSQAQQTIFDEFRQADDGFHRGGTGLGLAIVRKLVLQMDGSIQVHSEMGKGSTFTVTLPIKENENFLVSEEIL